MGRPQKPEIPESHPSRSSRNRRKWLIAEFEVGSPFRNAICYAKCRLALLCSKGHALGSRVVCRCVLVVPSYANAMMSCSRQHCAFRHISMQGHIGMQGHIASVICEWCFASSRRTSASSTSFCEWSGASFILIAEPFYSRCQVNMGSFFSFFVQGEWMVKSRNDTFSFPGNHQ